jgi:hypothetical protein
LTSTRQRAILLAKLDKPGGARRCKMAAMTFEDYEERFSILCGHVQRALRARDRVGLFREAVRAAALARELHLEEEAQRIEHVVGQAAARICAEIEPPDREEFKLRERLAALYRVSQPPR